MKWLFSPLDLATLGMINGGSWLYGHEIDTVQLQEALDKTIESYPVFAGRYAVDGIEYGSDGKTEILFARSGIRASELLRTWNLPGSLKARLDMKAFRNSAVPPLSVKVTSLADGTLISVAVNHSCADGATLMNFMRDWANTFRGEKTERPLFDQSFLPPQIHNRQELMRILPEQGWYPVSIKILLARLRDVFTGVGRVSPKAVFCGGRYSNGMVCELLSKAAANDPKFVTTVDLRGRSVPERFCGNAVLNLQDISLLHDKAKLTQMFQLTMESIGQKLPFTSFDLLATSKRRPTCLMVNNFCKFHPYDIKFGNETPLKCYPNDLPDTIKIWPGHPDENGIYIILRGNAVRLYERMLQTAGKR